MKKFLGQSIGEYVRKKGITIASFAKSINTTRSNAYKIFNKNSIDIEQLRRISIVLRHNFFEDLANDPDLAQLCYEEDAADIQFHRVIGNVMRDLQIEGELTYGLGYNIEEDIPLPDYSLPWLITFTKGETFEERAKGKLDNIMSFRTHTKDDMIVIECINKPYGTQFLNIKIDYKTEEEWKEIIFYAYELAHDIYLQPTKRLINRINDR